jgi:hypothetical protein
MTDQFPTYEQQVEKFHKAFTPEEAAIVRVDEGIMEIRVLFDGYDEQEEQKKFVDPEAGYASENQFEVAYHILMEYWDSLPDEEKESINTRLAAVEV